MPNKYINCKLKQDYHLNRKQKQTKKCFGLILSISCPPSVNNKRINQQLGVRRWILIRRGIKIRNFNFTCFVTIRINTEYGNTLNTCTTASLFADLPANREKQNSDISYEEKGANILKKYQQRTVRVLWTLGDISRK